MSTKPGGNQAEGIGIEVMSFSRLFKRSKHTDQAHSLYLAVVEQARRPAFYRHCGAPDTIDGRFEMILIHAVMLLRRLRDEGEAGSELGQVMFDVLIDDMDQSLREMGVGDMGVGRRVKAMARAFFGRAAAYEAALSAADDDSGEALMAALRRNLFGTVSVDDGAVAVVADYMRSVSARLEGQSGAGLLAGAVSFGEAPGGDEWGCADG